MTEPEQLKSVEEFLFGAPLYKTYKLSNDLEIVKTIYGRIIQYGRVVKVRVDGHCPFCGKESTFFVRGAEVEATFSIDDIKKRYSHDEMSITCVRNDYHVVRYYFRIESMTLQKIGQFPSLADISNDEVAQYRKGMTSEDAREFHKAIGLAAHGVGVGSFVYLRRVFERLISGRYKEFKDAEGWKDEEFFGLRMIDKIKLLKDHLPEFLVENAKVYSILSIGIHELDEEACLGYFDLMKNSIIIILDEDKRKKEELALKRSFTAAIKEFKPPTES